MVNSPPPFFLSQSCLLRIFCAVLTIPRSRSSRNLSCPTKGPPFQDSPSVGRFGAVQFHSRILRGYSFSEVGVLSLPHPRWEVSTPPPGSFVRGPWPPKVITYAYAYFPPPGSWSLVSSWISPRVLTEITVRRITFFLRIRRTVCSQFPGSGTGGGGIFRAVKGS